MQWQGLYDGNSHPGLNQARQAYKEDSKRNTPSQKRSFGPQRGPLPAVEC